MEWGKLIIEILASLSVVIPLVIKLIEYVQKSIKERNWNQLLTLVMGYMQTAEQKFEKGADKKEWVLAMVAASAKTVNYDINLDVVSALIDDLCAMSKVVNAPTPEAGE